VRAVPSAAALGDLSAGRTVPWADLSSSRRWSSFVRGTAVPPADHVELGELFRVHRGQVTGCNRVWIEGPHSSAVPRRFLYPAVTRARELLAAGEALAEDETLRRIVDLPEDLEELAGNERSAVRGFLEGARACGADATYIARHRRPWWSVKLKPPAPILCTYMARRPPAFVRNLAFARHINIAHGLYPRDVMSEQTMRALTAWLRANVRVEAGRTYAGGLTKFEPGEIERICIPSLRVLTELAQRHASTGHSSAAAIAHNHARAA
jgi:adenine-specific DNA-methyltransferase